MALQCWSCSSDQATGAFCNDYFDVNNIPLDTKRFSYATCQPPSQHIVALGARAGCQKVIDRGKFHDMETFVFGWYNWICNLNVFCEYNLTFIWILQLTIEWLPDEDVSIWIQMIPKTHVWENKYPHLFIDNFVKLATLMVVMVQLNTVQPLYLSLFRLLQRSSYFCERS